jgi:hypothetical protein
MDNEEIHMYVIFNWFFSPRCLDKEMVQEILKFLDIWKFAINYLIFLLKSTNHFVKHNCKTYNQH